MDAARDEDAELAALVGEYGGLIRGVVAKVSGRKDDDLADEVVQRVTAALWKLLRGAQTIHHPASYLYRCAVRETIRELRRELASDDPDQLHMVPDEVAASPEHAARAGELARTTEAALAAMSPDRALAVRAHLVGYPVEEVMTMYGWTYQKARNLIARGMSDLRTALAAKGYP
jgi:RNA polymerase sigma factor (sigma-70 family)